MSAAEARAANAGGTISFEAFLSEAETYANALPATTRAAQDAFVFRTAARALLVDAFPVPKLFPMGDFAPGVEIGPIGRAGPLMLIAYRMAPHALLPAHDHPNYAVATLGIEGEVQVRHFETGGNAPAYHQPDSFTVRRTSERVLRAGDLTTLSPRRDNIHSFTAGGEGAYFLDLTSSHGDDAGFSYLQVERAPAEAGGNLFRAKWVKF